MRPLLTIALLCAACAPPATGSPSIAPTPTVAAASPSAASPSVRPTATPSPIALPAFAGISAPGDQVVWMLVAGTRLFRSTDRGDSWTERPLPPQPVAPVIAFLDGSIGWMVNPSAPATQCQSRSLRLETTTDGGATWQAQTGTGIDPGQCSQHVALVSARSGYVDTFSVTGPPVIYRTTDGGATWAGSAPLPDPPGFTTTGGGATLRPGAVHAFAGTLLVEAAGLGGGQPRRYAFASDDGGASWRSVATAPNGGEPIVFVTATRWLQLAGPGDSRETTDGGATWHAFDTDYSQAAPIAPDVAFGSPDVGYATVRGTLKRTIDGGRHWVALRTPGT